MKMVLQKKVLSMHHSIKRFLCKRCWSVLLPGLTATIRTKRRREKHIVLTCLQCKAVRRFMTKQGYELWCDSAQSKLPSTSVEDQHPLEARSNSNPLRQAGGENKKDHSKVDASQVNTLDVDVKLTLNDICSKVDERLGDDVHVITSRFDEQDKTAIRK
ncbi:PREDICTED: ribonuclease P protein subunit p21-like [Priapulus caudatus]|uniref:Ribonuclease P protein subunit p21-like n=1 Tax=Priapulus caudatus TaxID=37621 RepID=A0ABM1DQ62_PRICU|nr:PREDICTED: ribonuclease P protein subunit p21-like [Priapulus caudatus]